MKELSTLDSPIVSPHAVESSKAQQRTNDGLVLNPGDIIKCMDFNGDSFELSPGQAVAKLASQEPMSNGGLVTNNDEAVSQPKLHTKNPSLRRTYFKKRISQDVFLGKPGDQADLEMSIKNGGPKNMLHNGRTGSKASSNLMASSTISSSNPKTPTRKDGNPGKH